MNPELIAIMRMARVICTLEDQCVAMGQEIDRLTRENAELKSAAVVATTATASTETASGTVPTTLTKP